MDGVGNNKGVYDVRNLSPTALEDIKNILKLSGTEAPFNGKGLSFLNLGKSLPSGNGNPPVEDLGEPTVIDWSECKTNIERVCAELVVLSGEAMVNYCMELSDNTGKSLVVKQENQLKKVKDELKQPDTESNEAVAKAMKWTGIVAADAGAIISAIFTLGATTPLAVSACVGTAMGVTDEAGGFEAMEESIVESRMKDGESKEEAQEVASNANTGLQVGVQVILIIVTAGAGGGGGGGGAGAGAGAAGGGGANGVAGVTEKAGETLGKSAGEIAKGATQIGGKAAEEGAKQITEQALKTAMENVDDIAQTGEGLVNNVPGPVGEGLGGLNPQPVGGEPVAPQVEGVNPNGGVPGEGGKPANVTGNTEPEYVNGVSEKPKADPVARMKTAKKLAKFLKIGQAVISGGLGITQSALGFKTGKEQYEADKAKSKSFGAKAGMVEVEKIMEEGTELLNDALDDLGNLTANLVEILGGDADAAKEIDEQFKETA